MTSTFALPSARTWLIAAALGAIVAAAIVLRFADLASIPGGLYPDEAAEGITAQRLLHEPGYLPVLVPEGGGREALFAYLVAAVFRFAGETTLALRATAAGLGVAGVVAIWLLGRRFGDLVGLIAAGWAAGSLWLIAVSRDGMRDTIVPLFGALALVTLIGWAHRPTRRTALLAGAAIALASLYTYQPLKLLPILVILWLAWVRRVDRVTYLRLRSDVRLFVTAFLVVGAPMIVSAALDPASFFGRALGVTPLNPGVQADASPIAHMLRTIGMFGLTGDPNARHNVDGWPLFGWPILGGLIAIVVLAGTVRLWRCRHDPAHAVVLWSLPIFLLPPLVATEGGSPHFLRSLGLAAPLAVAIGLGAVELSERAGAHWGRRATPGLAATSMAVLVALGWINGSAYLGRPVEARYDAFSFDLVALADAASRGAADAVVVDDYSAYVVRFLDAQHLPAIVPPRGPIPRPEVYHRLLARSLDDLASVVGPALAARATPIAWGPDGRPSVWAVAP